MMGWKPMNERELKLLKQHPKSVFVFAHTSFLDFMVYLAYRHDFDVIGRRTRVLINPMFTDHFQWFLQYFGSIPATRREIKDGGATKRIIEHLETMDEFIFALSPKGSTEAHHSWRSGFYHIAKHFDCPIFPVGLDFEKQCLIIKDPFFVTDMTLDQAVQKGKDELYDIIPYNPHKAEYPVGPHDPHKIQVMSTWRWVILILVIVILITAIVVMIWWLVHLCRHKSIVHEPTECETMNWIHDGQINNNDEVEWL